MGNLSVDWEKRWKVYLSYKNEIPTLEDLKTIKALVFPGSSKAVYDERNLFVPVVSELIRNVMNDYHQIKLFGSCFGHQIFAHALGGRVEQMKSIAPERVKIIGREHI
jgi:GMP synthase-like glutamine amidotransferase